MTTQTLETASTQTNRGAQMTAITKTGLDLFETNWPQAIKNAKVGLLVNHASINHQLQHAVDLFVDSQQCKLTTLFGPQHGIYGQTQDNMIEWEGFRDDKTGLLTYSLYGTHRKPQPEMFKDIDALVIDLQDIGARYYTFIWTMELCMQACAEQHKALVILDRPNPINGNSVEGPVLQTNFASFVGNRPLPIRHGMTIGEIALHLKKTYYPDVELHIIKMQNWQRSMYFEQTQLPWVLTSPNMPTIDTACVYPGMCLLEGTHISEGRGTTRPFEIFGAPYIEPEALCTQLSKFTLPGLKFRPLYFQPTFQKHASKICGGAQIHITDRSQYKPFKTAVAILKAIHTLYPEETLWTNPPYEYETVKLPFDILAGSDKLRNDILINRDLDEMEAQWNQEKTAFDQNMRRGALLY
jgi:uncharacterized protein YbbC (DUF1343 family)